MINRMTREEAIDIIRAERECVCRQGKTGECCRDDLGCGACDLVQEDDNIMEAYDIAIEALKEQDVEQIIDNLWGDIISTCTSYEVDGDKIITDVGYADEGIEFFIKHLKERLKEHS